MKICFFLMRIEKRSVSEEAEAVLKIFINPKQKNGKPESGRRKELESALYTPSEFKEQQRGTERNTTEKNNGQLSERSVLVSRVPGISRRDALLHNRANL